MIKKEFIIEGRFTPVRRRGRVGSIATEWTDVWDNHNRNFFFTLEEVMKRDLWVFDDRHNRWMIEVMNKEDENYLIELDKFIYGN